MKRLRESGPWLMLSLLIGFATPSLVIFVLQVGPGNRSVSEAFQDIMSRQFASDHLFLLAIFTLVPFLILDGLLLWGLPATLSSRHIAFITLGGILGILGLLLPIHWEVWSPLYTGHRMGSTAVLGLYAAPFASIITMPVGMAIGWLAAKLPVSRSVRQSVMPGHEPDTAADLLRKQERNTL